MARELIEIAREAVLDRCSRLEPEEVSLDDALGRVLAENVSSTVAVPPFDNSAMDGYSVRAVDTRGAAPGAW
jgi:molybdopterin molybdotransferase